MERAGGPKYCVCLKCLALLCPLFIPHPTRVHFSFIRAAPVLLLGGSCSARQNAEHSSGALASSQHFHLSISPDTASISLFPLLRRTPLLPIYFSLFFPPLCFLFCFSLPVVVDWVSECLWQLCVVCNRAERLVWIQRWENLFMWEMHRWGQVSRRSGLSLAVILHSGPDRRSEMAKYARRSARIPELHPVIQPMCVGVYSDLTEWSCVRAFPGWHAWSDSPATRSVQSPLLLSDRGERLDQLFPFYPIPVISFSDMLRLLSGAGIQRPVGDVCPAQTTYLVFSFSSLWICGYICFWRFTAVCPS